MVYVDNFYITGAGNFGRIKMSHMIADTSEELLDMADKLGLKRQWIQHPGTKREHFDVSISVRKRAIALLSGKINHTHHFRFLTIERRTEE